MPDPALDPAAQEARDEALVLVERGMDEDWAREAKRPLWERIKQGGEFTTDDLDCSEPREPRACGAIVMAASRAGLIENGPHAAVRAAQVPRAPEDRVASSAARSANNRGT